MNIFIDINMKILKFHLTENCNITVFGEWKKEKVPCGSSKRESLQFCREKLKNTVLKIEQYNNI